jgi:tyrosinase
VQIEELRRRAERLLEEDRTDEELAAFASPPAFSPFVPEHLARALALADRMMAVADASPDDHAGLAAALDEAENARAADPEATRHALMVFITHHGAGSQLPIPALEERRPDLVATARTAVAEADLEGVDGEALLGWFRTDPLANQHHEHWHVVYPHGGVPDGAGRFVPQDRQGEIFTYMHQQMLARYDAERLAAGLPPVVPIDDYRAAIDEGFDPDMPGRFLARPPGSVMADVDFGNGQTYTVAQHEAFRRAVDQAVDDGIFAGGAPIDDDRLGATLEATIATASQERYGNLHNLGHVLISEIGAEATPLHGVMWSPATAIMDPVFFRWHRHIDNISARWQEGQPPVDFGDAPPVRLRRNDDGASLDIAVCPVDAVADADDPGFDWAAWGATTFGGANWDRPAGQLDPTTDELRTHMATRRIPGQGSLGYLDHDDFVYVVRAENRAQAATDVTVRIFLVPDERADDRRCWIEMDKFGTQLASGEQTVVVRPSRLSSVIQKPAQRPPQPRREPGSNAALNYCNCGWPFNLLLPKGTVSGMPFRLLVILTDGRLDQVAPDASCGSLSFCGARDARYPDTRPMGYPFHRPFPGGVLDTLASLDSVGLVPLTIRHTGDPAGPARRPGPG